MQKMSYTIKLTMLSIEFAALVYAVAVVAVGIEFLMVQFDRFPLPELSSC